MAVFIRFPEKPTPQEPQGKLSDTFVEDFVKEVSKHLALFSIERDIPLRCVDDFAEHMYRAMCTHDYGYTRQKLDNVLRDPALYPMIEQRYLRRLHDHGDI